MNVYLCLPKFTRVNTDKSWISIYVYSYLLVFTYVDTGLAMIATVLSC